MHTKRKRKTKTKGTSAHKNKSEASSKTKMVKTPNKKPTQHAVVRKNGRVFRPNFDAKKLQDNYKMNMEKEGRRVCIDDTLFRIVMFVRTGLRSGTFHAPGAAGLYVPPCRDLQSNYLRMVQGGGDEVFPIQKTSALLCGKEKSRTSIISIGRQNKCVGDGSVCVSKDRKASRLHCFVLIDRVKNCVYVVDAGSRGGTTVKQGAFIAKLSANCSVHHPRIAVLKNESFAITVGGSPLRFTQNQYIAKPFVPSIGRQSLRPRKKD